ncbi:hypothetical protein SIO17_14925 [Pseudoalteromonas piscicida]|uniref:HlyD family secretion protein n=1 Tax=Pseudoalteromonas piscicida TaxID=43662 RepID=A0ABM6NH40_PSEO7|nr:hypothetical protein [Pseudoalteromonas piscicida]ATD08355.1 hypothetical protein PPIS_a3590 [Pseudoalteromonas piscicida]WPU30401.1 hypothetical protein SIO17_14925 [Pseudoalteromonas piscicida]
MSSISLAPLLMLTASHLIGNIQVTKPAEVFYYFQEDALVVEFPVKPGERVEEGQTLLKYQSGHGAQTKDVRAQEDGFVKFIMGNDELNKEVKVGSLVSIISSSKVLAVVDLHMAQYNQTQIDGSFWLCLNNEEVELTVTKFTGEHLLTTFELPSYNSQLLGLDPQQEVNFYFDKADCIKSRGINIAERK